jgi:hypothetical protein
MGFLFVKFVALPHNLIFYMVWKAVSLSKITFLILNVSPPKHHDLASVLQICILVHPETNEQIFFSFIANIIVQTTKNIKVLKL